MELIRPELQADIRRRSEDRGAAHHRPRQLSAILGAAAVAAACAVMFLVLGSSSGSGLLSPERAVAKVAHSLASDGVLHWVRRGDLVTNAAARERPGTVVDEEWIDLKSGDSHRITTTSPAPGEATGMTETWSEGGELWIAMQTGSAPGDRVVQRTPSAREGFTPPTIIDDVRAMLARADDGLADIADGGEQNGVPLAVITDTTTDATIRTWITRESEPRVVKSSVSASSRNASAPITTTTTTDTWEVLPRSEAALSKVKIPAAARRRG